jgi:hypothetical protein
VEGAWFKKLGHKNSIKQKNKKKISEELLLKPIFR